MPSLSPAGSAVVFVDGGGTSHLFAYASDGPRYRTLHFHGGRVEWNRMRFDEIIDIVPVHHVVLLRGPLPVHHRTFEETSSAWRALLHTRLVSECTNERSLDECEIPRRHDAPSFGRPPSHPRMQ